MTQKAPSHLGIKLLTLILAGCFLLFWVYMDWPCVFRSVTGLPCPGCGMGRAWLAALRLDFFQALHWHPMFWSVPVLVLFLIFDGSLFRNDRLNACILGAVLLGLAAAYLIRLAAFFLGVYTF